MVHFVDPFMLVAQGRTPQEIRAAIASIPDELRRSDAMVQYAPMIQNRQHRRAYIQTIPDHDERQFARQMLQQDIRIQRQGPQQFFPDDADQLPQFNQQHSRRRPQEKQKMAILNYINGVTDHLDAHVVTIQGLRDFFDTIQLPYQRSQIKQEYLDHLTKYKQQLMRRKRQGQIQQTALIPQTGYDIFGTPIQTPVLGNDGAVYDKSSLDDWLRDRVKYTIVSGTVPLRSYRQLTRQEYQRMRK